jgi:hypothetical protein
MGKEFLSESTIHLYASRVADGTGNEVEARALIADFVRRRDKHVNAPPRLLEYLADCLRAFMDKERTLLQAPEVGRPAPVKIKVQTLEKAFGLAGPFQGHKPLSAQDALPIAHAVLRHRLEGATFEAARNAVAKSHGKSKSRVSEFWRIGKRDALMHERDLRPPDRYPWTKAEQKRLCEIYKNAKWFVPPGKDKQLRE